MAVELRDQNVCNVVPAGEHAPLEPTSAIVTGSYRFLETTGTSIKHFIDFKNPDHCLSFYFSVGAMCTI